MQVFMPYPDLKASVCCLDPKRLGNQIYREAKTLISGGWPNHPAAKIWKGYEHALADYCLLGLEELTRRGRDYVRWYKFFGDIYYNSPDTGFPPIIGYEPFHSGHRAALLAKGWADVMFEKYKGKTEPLRGYSYITFPERRKDWTLDHYKLISGFQNSEELLRESWYSKFGWTEKPEFDTKKAYLWSRRTPQEEELVKSQ